MPDLELRNHTDPGIMTVTTADMSGDLVSLVAPTVKHANTLTLTAPRPMLVATPPSAVSSPPTTDVSVLTAQLPTSISPLTIQMLSSEPSNLTLTVVKGTSGWKRATAKLDTWKYQCRKGLMS